MEFSLCEDNKQSTDGHVNRSGYFVVFWRSFSQKLSKWVSGDTGIQHLPLLRLMCK